MSIKSLNINPDRGTKQQQADAESTVGGSQTLTTDNTNQPVYDNGFNDTWYATELTLIREHRQCIQCGAVETVSGGPLVRMDCVMNPHRHRLVIPENAPAHVDKQLLPRTITHIQSELKRCVECFKPTPEDEIVRPPAPTWASILQNRRERGGNDFIEAMRPKDSNKNRKNKTKKEKAEVTATDLTDFL